MGAGTEGFGTDFSLACCLLDLELRRKGMLGVDIYGIKGVNFSLK